MKKYENARSHWFTVADALILLLVIGLIVAAVALFLFPPTEEDEAKLASVSLDLTLEKDSEELLEHVGVGDKVFSGETAIGEVVSKDINNRYVLVTVSLEVEDNGSYSLNGEPIMINSKFVLETKVCSINSTVVGLSVKEEQ